MDSDEATVGGMSIFAILMTTGSYESVIARLETVMMCWVGEVD